MDALLYYGLVKTLTKHQSHVKIYGNILSITTLQIKYYIILYSFFNDFSVQ